MVWVGEGDASATQPESSNCSGTNYRVNTRATSLPLLSDSQRVVIVVVVVVAAEQFSDHKSADDRIRVNFLFLRGHRRHREIRVEKSGGAKSEVENCHFGVATLEPQTM